MSTKKILTQDYSDIKNNVIGKLTVPPKLQSISKDSVHIENHFFYPILGANGLPNISNFIYMLEGSIRRFSLSAKELARHRQLTLDGNDIEAENIAQIGRRRFVKYTKETAKSAGEIGELALFIILEAFFDAPKIASKMKLKTNNDMHVHGSDAIHAILGDDQILNLILGESKFRNSRTAALKDAIASMDTFLSDYLKVGKEIELIEGNLDHEVLDPALKESLLGYFGKFTPESNQSIKTIAVLLGYDRISLYKGLDKFSDIALRKIELEKRYLEHAQEVADEFVAALLAEKNPNFKEVRFLYALIPFSDLNVLKTEFYKLAGLTK